METPDYSVDPLLVELISNVATLNKSLAGEIPDARAEKLLTTKSDIGTVKDRNPLIITKTTNPFEHLQMLSPKELAEQYGISDEDLEADKNQRTYERRGFIMQFLTRFARPWPRWIVTALDISYASFIGWMFSTKLIEELSVGMSALFSAHFAAASTHLAPFIGKKCMLFVEHKVNHGASEELIRAFSLGLVDYTTRSCIPFNRELLMNNLMSFVQYSDGKQYSFPYISDLPDVVNFEKIEELAANTPFLGREKMMTTLGLVATIASACAHDIRYQFLINNLSSALTASTGVSQDDLNRATKLANIQKVAMSLVFKDAISADHETTAAKTLALDKEFGDLADRLSQHSAFGRIVSKLGGVGYAVVSMLMSLLSFRLTQAVTNVGYLSADILGVQSNTGVAAVMQRLTVLTILMTRLLEMTDSQNESLKALHKACTDVNLIMALSGRAPLSDAVCTFHSFTIEKANPREFAICPSYGHIVHHHLLAIQHETLHPFRKRIREGAVRFFNAVLRIHVSELEAALAPVQVWCETMQCAVKSQHSMAAFLDSYTAGACIPQASRFEADINTLLTHEHSFLASDELVENKQLRITRVMGRLHKLIRSAMYVQGQSARVSAKPVRDDDDTGTGKSKEAAEINAAVGKSLNAYNAEVKAARNRNASSGATALSRGIAQGAQFVGNAVSRGAKGILQATDAALFNWLDGWADAWIDDIEAAKAALATADKEMANAKVKARAVANARVKAVDNTRWSVEDAKNNVRVLDVLEKEKLATLTKPMTFTAESELLRIAEVQTVRNDFNALRLAHEALIKTHNEAVRDKGAALRVHGIQPVHFNVDNFVEKATHDRLQRCKVDLLTTESFNSCISEIFRGTFDRPIVVIKPPVGETVKDDNEFFCVMKVHDPTKFEEELGHKLVTFFKHTFVPFGPFKADVVVYEDCIRVDSAYDQPGPDVSLAQYGSYYSNVQLMNDAQYADFKTRVEKENLDIYMGQSADFRSFVVLKIAISPVDVMDANGEVISENLGLCKAVEPVMNAAMQRTIAKAATNFSWDAIWAYLRSTDERRVDDGNGKHVKHTLLSLAHVESGLRYATTSRVTGVLSSLPLDLRGTLVTRLNEGSGSSTDEELLKASMLTEVTQDGATGDLKHLLSANSVEAHDLLKLCLWEPRFLTFLNTAPDCVFISVSPYPDFKLSDADCDVWGFVDRHAVPDDSYRIVLLATKYKKKFKQFAANTLYWHGASLNRPISFHGNASDSIELQSIWWGKTSTMVSLVNVMSRSTASKGGRPVVRRRTVPAALALAAAVPKRKRKSKPIARRLSHPSP